MHHTVLFTNLVPRSSLNFGEASSLRSRACQLHLSSSRLSLLASNPDLIISELSFNDCSARGCGHFRGKSSARWEVCANVSPIIVPVRSSLCGVHGPICEHNVTRANNAAVFFQLSPPPPAPFYSIVTCPVLTNWSRCLTLPLKARNRKR
jgi:hypothetical protein